MDAEEIRAAARRRRAERKLAQQRAVAGGVWTRCLYKVPGKERYCAQHRSTLSTKYCGTHMGETEEKGRRVPCPVDPNHTVFEHQLAAHAKICNLTILQARMEAQPYYSKGINSGPPLSDGEEEEEGEKAEGRGNASEGAFDEPFLLDLISRVAAAHRDLVGEIPTEVLDHIPEVQPLHRTRTEDGKGFRKGRHILQQASLVGHLVKRGLAGPVGDHDENGNNKTDGTVNNANGTVGGPRVLHVEMGAGKGALGQSIAAAFPGAEVTMVERSSVRRKAENRLDGVSARARIDIRDLNMAGLPSLAPPSGEEARSTGGGGGDGGKPVVAVAKHLCGVATDLALRAMLTLTPPPPEPPQAARQPGTSGADGGGGGAVGETATAATGVPPEAAAASRVGGVAVATCCHHVCNWRDYAGREFLSRQGFTARDFEAMRRMSAWISLEPEAGMRKNNKYPDEKHPAAATAAAAAAVGADSTATLPLPLSSSSKTVAAAKPPTIAEEGDGFSEEVTDASRRGAVSSPSAADPPVGSGAVVACSDGGGCAAADAPAPANPEVSQKTVVVGSSRAGDFDIHPLVQARTESSARETEAEEERLREPSRVGGGGVGEGRRGVGAGGVGGDEDVPSRLGAESAPPPLPPPPSAATLPPPRSPAADDEPTAVTRPRNDRSAAESAEGSDDAGGGGGDGDDDDDNDDNNGHHQRDHAPHATFAATLSAAVVAAAARGDGVTGVSAAVVAARVPRPLLALGALSPAEKARAARECKRLIDRGRRAFIEERLGLASEVVHFVGRDVTPENALLLGFRGEGDSSG